MKSSSPASDRLGTHPKPLTDLGVAMALRGQQYELGAQHLTVWARVARRLMLKLLALGLFEHDLLGSHSRHRLHDSPAPSRLLQSGRDFWRTALSLGSQSEAGEQRTARLLSAHTTCRLQHRPLHAYLTDAIAAHARGDPVPQLT